MTAEINCIVEVKLLNLVQITSRLEIPIDDFYKDDALTNFIDKITAFLLISTDRLRIVGIRQVTSLRGRQLATS